MNLDFSGAEVAITSEDILRRVSEYDIFLRYCSNFKEVDVSFCSDLRSDRDPDCRIYVNRSNHLMYKDFASGEHYSCFGYVMAKYGCIFPEAVNIVANDFNLRSNVTSLNPRVIVANDEIRINPVLTPRLKSNISIIEQPFTIVDYEYWNQFGISLELLEEYNVFSAKTVYLIKGFKRTTFQYTKKNPCYAYRFTRDGQYNYKIYWPLGEKNFKWLFSGGAMEDHEGADQLDLFGDLLIITKSLKDVMVLRTLGYNAISLQGEANKLLYEEYQKYSKRFSKIISLYDNDEAGEKGANYLKNTYNIPMIFIPRDSNCKDISDYVKMYGLEESRKLMILLL